MGHTFLFLCMLYNFLLRSGHSEYYKVVALENLILLLLSVRWFFLLRVGTIHLCLFQTTFIRCVFLITCGRQSLYVIISAVSPWPGKIHTFSAKIKGSSPLNLSKDTSREQLSPKLGRTKAGVCTRPSGGHQTNRNAQTQIFKDKIATAHPGTKPATPRTQAAITTVTVGTVEWERVSSWFMDSVYCWYDKSAASPSSGTPLIVINVWLISRALKWLIIIVLSSSTFASVEEELTPRAPYSTILYNTRMNFLVTGIYFLILVLLLFWYIIDR